jgi:rod shape-determining protein MreD
VTRKVSIPHQALVAVVLAVALFAAVIVQLTVVNRIPLPGPAAPDLVLLLVTAIAVTTTPAVGAVAGFTGGLALDIAPPAAHYAGEYALVFCLVGYAAARTVRVIWDMTGERDKLISFTVMAVAAAAGEAGKAAFGMLLSDPDVTGTVVSRVLPGAILYDLLLALFAFWLVAWITRGAVSWNAAPERAPAPLLPREQRLASVFRQASAGATPNLRLAGTGENYASPSVPRRVPKLRFAGTGGNYASPSVARRVPKLRFAGTGGNYASPSVARRVPKLRLSDARSRSSLRTAAVSAHGSPFAAGRTAKLSFGGDFPVRSTTRASSPVRTPGKNWLKGTARSSVPAATRTARGPARGWLRSSGSAALAGRRPPGSASGLPRGFMGGARSVGSPIAARQARTPAEALAARSAPSGLSALSGTGTPLAGRSPRAGWLRTSRSAAQVSPVRQLSPRPGWLRTSRSAAQVFPVRQLSPRTGWLGSARRPRTVIGSGVGTRGRRFRRRGTAGGNWYGGTPSGAWLRRSRNPWRKRRQRLLRMVGVGK